jgi:tRNA threonylcarbamoyladenosine biosynthesis protein TsaB
VNILAIDTTSRAVNVALAKNKKIFSVEKDLNPGEYEEIISLINTICRKSKVKLEDLDYFGVCNGPGSFTGMRIGLATVKALGYSLNKPVVAYKSLDLLAWMVKDEFSGLLCVMQDARRDNVYSAVYSKNSHLKRITPYILTGFAELSKKLKHLRRKSSKIYFYGDAAWHYKDKIKEFFCEYKIIKDYHAKLKSRAMISWVKNNINTKKSAFRILPFYMYPRDCQVNKQVK